MASIFQAHNRARVPALIMTAAVVAQVIGLALAVPTAGTLGAALASASASAIACLLLYVALNVERWNVERSQQILDVEGSTFNFNTQRSNVQRSNVQRSTYIVRQGIALLALGLMVCRWGCGWREPIACWWPPGSRRPWSSTVLSASPSTLWMCVSWSGQGPNGGCCGRDSRQYRWAHLGGGAVSKQVTG